jgi:hypothetical protein
MCRTCVHFDFRRQVRRREGLLQDILLGGALRTVPSRDIL